MALLSIPIALSVALSFGEQIYEAYFPKADGSHASYSCGRDVDLRDPGQSMASVPFLNQGDLNVCAPYTASEMIDAWRIRKLGRPLHPDERTSPIALAIEFAARNDFPYSFPIQNSTDPLATEKFRWGGIVCVSVNSAREIGVCTDDVLKETQGQSLEALTKADTLFLLLRDYQRLKPEIREEKRGRIAERIFTILSSFPPPMETKFLPSKKQIDEELTFFTGDDPYVPLSRLLLGKCRSKRTPIPDLPNCRTKFDAGLDAYGWNLKHVPFRETDSFKTLKELLERDKPMPISIAYCHRVIRKGFDYRPTSILSGNCSQHWSLAIGSRQKSGRCQILVRDTDGGKPDRVSADWEIDHGDVWVDAETLMSSVYALEWLE